MCGLGCGGNKSAKSNSYTPKKLKSAGSKSPSTRGGLRSMGMSGFGTPKVRMSFGRGRR